jgi:ATP-dependent DNA helicase RecG
MLPAPLPIDEALPALRDALRGIHLPGTMDDYRRGLRRELFDDLFEFQLGLAMRRRAWQKRESAPVLPTTTKVDSRIRRLFPFRFTQGQDAAVREIIEDLRSGRAMHRLLQADVGAGKTAIAMYAMLVAIAAGYQTVLMAPTEILASQHWATVDAALAHSQVKRVLLTGQLTPARRRRALDDIRAGATQLVVGTQAVIQEGVRFGRLGVAVIDEQHKFGVVQRAKFSSDEKLSPHVLVMTATPIPRSLCLTQFGDLDITTISELPPGRQKIITSRVTGAKARERAWEFVRKQLRSGRQAYIVCPRVSASGDGDDEDFEASGGRVGQGSGVRGQGSVQSTECSVPNTQSAEFRGLTPPVRQGQSVDATTDSGLPASAEEVYEQLRTGELKDFRVGLVHGQMDRQAKASAMEAFREGETQALVSTTVVEVGVDVANATLMVVNQAERFGLSQLHQLRGRVGAASSRGTACSFRTPTPTTPRRG